MIPNNINTIIFDLGNVILDLDIDATVHAFKKYNPAKFEAFQSQAFADNIFQKIETNEMSADEFRNYFKTKLDPDLTYDQIDAAWNQLLVTIPKERIELIQDLKANYQLFLLSNTNEIHLKWIENYVQQKFGFEKLGVLFSKAYYSHLVEMRKPNPEIFKMVLKENELDPINTLFIDDTDEHILSATTLGIKTIHLTPAMELTSLFK